MPDNPFDELLENKLRDHRSPVPDDMWDRIIRKKDDDRGLAFFWTFICGILAFTVCLGGYLYFEKNDKQNFNSGKIETAKSTHIEVPD